MAQFSLGSVKFSRRSVFWWLAIGGFALLAGGAPAPQGHGQAPSRALAGIAIDYPEDGSIFPPEITPPTFLWRDPDKTAATWRVDVSFSGGAAAIHAMSRGERMTIGAIDPDCVAASNEPPKLTPQQAASHTWTPTPAMWELIKKRSVSGPAAVTITGFRRGEPSRAVSRGSARISTSRDPVAAPVFYRDVPLMPSETEAGVIKPLAAVALPLVAWRLRNIAQPASRVVMRDLPVCANCHSFSADGKTLGMDLDGLQNNKSRYTLTAVAAQTSIGMKNVIEWSTEKGKLQDSVRAGFMSQVSPDGQYVATTIDPAGQSPASERHGSNYYVANFNDYKFLQVFYPTRGILAWYSRETGTLRPIAGADDPRFVQMGGVWSPDGKYLVFARAEAHEAYPKGAPLARFSNDPNELQMRFDLYRVPFNDGRGGVAEPIAGASQNGMSNSFPKVSPDGRWIVFVKARNGLLMRPDSQLYIVPAAGGEARRMRCNTTLMNSWHSFSPNGRWLVFSSKSRSPYTQMYLTHIGPDGSDSPAILVGNTTAANRAVNLPEFVNIAPDDLRSIGGPAIDYYRLVDSAFYLQKHQRAAESLPLWRQALDIDDGDETVHRGFATALLQSGRAGEAAAQVDKADEIGLRKAVEASPGSAPSYNDLGALLLRMGRVDESIVQSRKASELDPQLATARCNLGAALLAKGNVQEALAELRKSTALDPAYAPAWYQLGRALERHGERDEAVRSWEKALALDPKMAEAHVSLGSALQAGGRTAEAVEHWRKALDLAPHDAVTTRRLAWALATSPDAKLRNGSEALALAVRAVQLSGGRDAEYFDTLAAAYAERERFGDAAATEQRALNLAGQSELAKAIRLRLALYQAGQPYRELQNSAGRP